MPVDLSKMSFGLELELADVLRGLEIPPELGEWEYSETDIVNSRPPYRNVAADPAGISPPLGGEVNLTPAWTPEELAEKARRLMEFFEGNGYPPSHSCVSHTHIHVHVPGLREDWSARNRVLEYLRRWQEPVIQSASKFREPPPEVRAIPGAYSYLKWDGARRLPEWLINNLIEHGRTPEDFFRVYSSSRDMTARTRPIRHGINLYCLKHTNTVEFRMFRSTIDPRQIRDCAEFCRRFFASAFSEEMQMFRTDDLDLPDFWWDIEQLEGWARTKKAGNPRGKVRRFIPMEGQHDS